MTMPAKDDLAQEFVRFSVLSGVLRFGEFKTKAGRLSPYFFNAGLFDDGAKLGRLASFYARRLLASGIQFDMLFGPAYKGITLAAAVAIELARLGRVAHVGADAERLGAQGTQAIGSRLYLVRRAADDRDMGTGARKRLGQPQVDAAGAAGNEDMAAAEVRRCRHG